MTYPPTKTCQTGPCFLGSVSDMVNILNRSVLDNKNVFLVKDGYKFIDNIYQVSGTSMGEPVIFLLDTPWHITFHHPSPPTFPTGTTQITNSTLDNQVAPIKYCIDCQKDEPQLRDLVAYDQPKEMSVHENAQLLFNFYMYVIHPYIVKERRLEEFRLRARQVFMKQTEEERRLRMRVAFRRQLQQDTPPAPSQDIRLRLRKALGK